MASNQYGPAASYNNTPSRQPPAYPSRYEAYKTPQHSSQWNNNASNYQDSPFRDQNSNSSSPELHPGMGPGYDSSSSRSQGSYGYQPANNYNHNQYGPSTPQRSAAAQYAPDSSNREYADYASPRGPYQNSGYNSADRLMANAAPFPPSASSSRGNLSPTGRGYNGRGNGYNGSPTGPYRNPYDNHSISRGNFNGLEFFDPNAVADDGDDGLAYHNPKRRSLISLHRQSRGSTAALGAGAVTGLAAATAAQGHGSPFASKNASGNNLNGGGIYGENTNPLDNFEKTPAVSAAALKADEAKGRKCKKITFITLGVLILCGIVGGVLAAVLISRNNNKNSNSNSSNSSSSVDGGAISGVLDLNSPQVKQLLNNKNLHKVFTGMAYTPLHSQYPDCISNPPVQNNVTLDMAIISQVTNTIRLYGTDCNQTEYVLTAIDKLALPDMKVWLGVWLDNNATTNARQVTQMWDILDKYGTKYIKGIIMGNEVLFRQDMTATQLKSYITGAKTNLTARNYNLPVATADLGDNWTSDLAQAVDAVMSNVHPFFGGIEVPQAASWTWSFWQTHDVSLTAGMTGKQQIISEVGWPSQGGKDCGSSPTCDSSTPGAVAGISEMNQFMSEWVCQSLSNGTAYFWFEMLDEPWKIAYDTPGKEWEDHWGLFDVNRNLKPGVVIPNCNGQTVKQGGYP